MKRGSGWEARLITWHYEYQKADRADIAKMEPEARLVNGRLVYTRVGPPDFMGFIGPRSMPRGVVFDAKDTRKMVLYCSQLAPHQARYLECFGRRAFAFLCARIAGRQFVIPWAHVSRDYFGGAKVFRHEEVGREFGSDGWLPVVEQILAEAKQ